MNKPDSNNKRILLFVVIVFIMAGAGIGWAAIPQNTIRNNAGLVMPTVNATAGYWVGTNEVISTARAFTGISYTIGGNTLDTNEWGFLDGTNQALSTADSVTFNAVTGTSFVIGANTLTTTEWAFLDGQDQSVTTGSTVDFTEVDAGEYYLSSVNKTDIFKYPFETASYIISTDGANYFAKNGTTGAIDYSGADATTLLNIVLANGGRIIVLPGTYVDVELLTVPSNTSFIALDGVVFQVDISYSDGSIIKTQDAENVVISGFEIDRGFGGTLLGTWEAVVYINQSKRVFVDNLFIYNVGNVITETHSDVITINNSTDCIVDNIHMDNVYAHGILVRGGSQRIIVKNIFSTRNYYEDVIVEHPSSLPYPNKFISFENINVYNKSYNPNTGAMSSACWVGDAEYVTFKDVYVSGNGSKAFGTGSDPHLSRNIFVDNMVVHQDVANGPIINVGANDTGFWFTNVKVYSTVSGDEAFRIFGENVHIRDSVTIGGRIGTIGDFAKNVTIKNSYFHPQSGGNSLFIVTGATDIRIMGNTFINLGIHLTDPIGANIFIENNDLPIISTTGDLANIESLTNNNGVKTENIGTATINSGSSNVTVGTGIGAGGFSVGLHDIQVAPSADLGNCTYFWITDITQYDFKIVVGAGGAEKNTDSAITFVWSARRFHP